MTTVFTPQPLIQQRSRLADRLLARSAQGPQSTSPLSPIANLLFGISGGLNRNAANQAQLANQQLRTDTLSGLQNGGNVAQLLLRSQDPQLQGIGAKLLAANSKAGAPTALQRNLEAAGLKRGTPEFQDAVLKGTQRGTTVNIANKGQSKFIEALGSKQANALLEQRGKAQDAVSIIRTNQEARKLLDAGALTGFGAEALTTFGEALQRIGVNKFDDKIANTRAFASALGSNVGKVIKQFGSGTGLSDADREFATKMAGGDIKLTEKSIRRILDINDRQSQFIINNFNSRAQQIQDRFGDAIGFPLTIDVNAGFINQPAQSNPQAADTNIFPRVPQGAVDFLRQNSNDPTIVQQFEQKFGPGSAQRVLGQ